MKSTSPIGTLHDREMTIGANHASAIQPGDLYSAALEKRWASNICFLQVLFLRFFVRSRPWSALQREKSLLIYPPDSGRCCT